MKRLFAAAAFAPLCFAALEAQAQTTVTTSTTTPLQTSSSGDIAINVGGSVTVRSGGPAITVNSDNTVSNAGLISVRDSVDGTGILVITPAGGTTSTITNTGNIAADDAQGNVDADKDRDLDGRFVASDVKRYGIRVIGEGPFIGNISHDAGLIGVETNGGGGIVVETGLTGNLSTRSQIGVLGDNVVGVRVMGPVEGAINIGGLINANGENAVGLQLDGVVSGRVIIQGTVNATGFRYATRGAVPGNLEDLDADDLLIGGSAVRIRNSLQKGLFLESAPPDIDGTNNDEDVDGIPDDTETNAFVQVFGTAPALLIGDQADITLGVAGDTAATNWGLSLGGQTLGNGVFQGFGGTGARIGGLGGAVDIEGGIRVIGQVNGAGFEADTFGMILGAGASTPLLLVDTGTISAGVNALEGGDTKARALLIESGANLPQIHNNGIIRAGIQGTIGSASAIVDQSGTLATFTNSGRVTAEILTGDVDLPSIGEKIALDLRANTSGVTLKQILGPNADFEPQIIGDILLGTGAAPDDLAIEAGRTSGAIAFGGGDDKLLLAEKAVSRIDLRKDGGQLAVDVRGQMNLTNTTSVTLSSLAVGSQGLLTFTADPSQSNPDRRVTRLDVNGEAVLNSGSRLDLEFVSKLNGPATFEILRANTLTNQGVDTSLVSSLPFIFTGEARIVGNSVLADVRPRETSELGLFGGRGAAYRAFYNAFDKDPGVSRAVFGKTDAASFAELYEQFLPDYSSGPFNGLASGARAVFQVQAEEAKDMVPGEPRSWLQEVGVGTKFETVHDIDYQTAGFGVAAGFEKPLGAGNHVVGVSGSFVSSEIRNANRAFGSLLNGSVLMSSLYWRSQERGMVIDASFSGGYAWFESDRRIVDETDQGVQSLIRQASAEWRGAMGAARVGVSYDWEAGPFYVRHDATFDAVYLREGAYTETGGGPGVNLMVRQRETYEAAAEAGILLGARFGRSFRWGPEIRVAYRGMIDGGEGSTIGAFASSPGDAFILPGLIKDRQRIVVRAAVRGSGAYSNFAFEASGDIGEVYQAYMARFVVRFLF